MAELVYICGAIVSTACAVLLARSYFQNRARLLLWVGLSFGFLALNNIFVCIDLILLPEVELWGNLVRNALFAFAGSILTVGLVWELS